MAGTAPINATDRTRRDLGRANKRAVMAEIVFNGPVSRTAICQATGLTAASVSRITRELIGAGLVIEDSAPAETGRPGRKFVGLDVNPAGGYVLGIGLNVFQQTVTLADLKNNRLERRDLKLADLSRPDRVIAEIAAAARDMIAVHVAEPARLFGGGVAITGAVDPVSGCVRESLYLGWRDVGLGGQLASALNIPFQVDSLPNTINLAEVRFGAARGARNTLLINCAIGLGASLYLDGQLVRGHKFYAGHIGNLPTRDSVAVLDDVAGGRGILKAMGEADPGTGVTQADAVAGKLMAIIDMANAGEVKATEVIEHGGHALGETAAVFAGLTRPERIVLSGPLAESPAYVSGFRSAMAAQGMGEPAVVELAISDLTAQAAARWLAIGEFLVERDINLDNLKLAGAA